MPSNRPQRRRLPRAAVEQRIQRVAEMVRSGMKNREIAAALGVSVHSVNSYLAVARKKGILAGSERRSTPEIIAARTEQIIELHKSGMVPEEIASELNIGIGSVRDIIRNAQARGQAELTKTRARRMEALRLAVVEGIPLNEIEQRIRFPGGMPSEMRGALERRLRINVLHSEGKNANQIAIALHSSPQTIARDLAAIEFVKSRGTQPIMAEMPGQPSAVRRRARPQAEAMPRAVTPPAMATKRVGGPPAEERGIVRPAPGSEIRVAYNAAKTVAPDRILRTDTREFEGVKVVSVLYGSREYPSLAHCIEAEGKLHPISDEDFVLRFLRRHPGIFRG